MPGAGYNIPISISSASTFSVPQTTNAPTYINFGTGAQQGGDIAQNPSNINPATATSAAAEGNADAKSSGSGVEGLLPTGGTNSKTMIVIAASVVAVALIIGAAIYFRK